MSLLNGLLEQFLPGVENASVWGSNKNMDFSGSSSVLLPSGTTIGGSSLTALGTITSTSANAFSVGPAGTTNPTFNVDASTASAADGIDIVGLASGSGATVAVITPGTNSPLKIDAAGSGTISLGSISTGAVVVGGATSHSPLQVSSTSASALVVGRQGSTNPVLKVDASTGTVITGLSIKGAATTNGIALLALDTNANTGFTLDAKGTGAVNINTLSATAGAVTLGNTTSLAGAVINGATIDNHATAAINSTATATAAQVATGYITSTSAAGTTITLPTGTLLGTQLGATQGTIFDLTIDNTAGANTVTIAVAVNGILSALATAVSTSGGLLTVPSGVTGQGVFRLMFSSATAYTFTRIA